MKKIEVKVRYLFEGTYTVAADDRNEARTMVTRDCGLVLGGNIHTTLDDDEVDWEFDVHPDMQILSYTDLEKEQKPKHLKMDFSDRIETLRKDIIDAIRQLLYSHGLTEITFPEEQYDPVWVIWFDNNADPFECMVTGIQVTDNSMTVIAHEKEANFEATCHTPFELGASNIDWLQQMYDAVWQRFTCADLIRFITSRHLECHLIGMLKMGKTRYRTEAGNLNAPVIIDRLKKEKSVRYSRKLNCYYAHMDAEYANRKIRIFFCKRGRKGAWNAFLSTDTRLDFFEAYRIYSMRWAIEVCFSEMKGLLRLGKCQCRNFSSQIASISLTLMQYNILSHIKRFEAYETIGGLFDRTVNGAMELSVTERIWELILQIVAVIAELFSADEEEIIRMIAYDNPKINIIKDLCGVKKTA